MTNFIYNMQDELFHLNMVLPVGDFSIIKKLVDHIEAQGKQLRELNASITKKNTTIEKYEYKNKDLQERNALLGKKVNELNQGIRNHEDLTWKQKYDALLHSSEQAIGALQKKCQEYKNADTIDALAKAVRCPWGDNAEIISAKTARIKELEERNKKLEERRDELKKMCEDIMVEKNAIIKELEEEKKAIEKRCREAEKALEHEKQVSKDLVVIINHKNNLLDEDMLESIYFRHEKTIKKLERDNDILRGKVNEISDLAESIVMLCDDEE